MSEQDYNTPPPTVYYAFIMQRGPESHHITAEVKGNMFKDEQRFGFTIRPAFHYPGSSAALNVTTSLSQVTQTALCQVRARTLPAARPSG